MQEVSELDTAIKDATDLRAKERAKNLETISDAKAAQQAVANALSVLRTFYEKAGEATSLAQSQKEQDDFLNDSSSNKASKTTEMEHKTSKKSSKEESSSRRRRTWPGPSRSSMRLWSTTRS